jgi:cytochrome oxidase assembly protein ShyY1
MADLLPRELRLARRTYWQTDLRIWGRRSHRSWLHSIEVDGSLFRGRYLVGHLVVLTLAGLFILAGFWQLDRLHEVRTRNAVVRSRMGSTPVPLDQVLQPNDVDPGKASYRRVVVAGHFDPSRQVLIQFRSYSGDPGDYLLTPLVTSNGAAILVNRGWIPPSDTPVQQARGLDPPPGDVRVTGILFPSEKRGSSPTDAGGGIVEATRIDLAVLGPGFSVPLYPAYLQLTAQDPAHSGDYPIVLPAPHLDNGPHLSYAIQWFSFTAIVLIGWPTLVRRSLGRSVQKGARAPE